MTEQYTHHIGGGGFSTSCDLKLDMQNNLFKILFDQMNWSSKNNIKIKGTIEYFKNNYYVLNTTQLLLNTKEYPCNSITFEFIKLSDTHEVSEYNNEWKDIEMGNRVIFNSNFTYNAMLIIQREIFDYGMVSSQHTELEKLLYWFSNMKFLEIEENEDSN